MTLAHVSEMPNHTRAERQGGRPQRGTSQTRPEQPGLRGGAAGRGPQPPPGTSHPQASDAQPKR